jgi:hypothetical protein
MLGGWLKDHIHINVDDVSVVERGQRFARYE